MYYCKRCKKEVEEDRWMPKWSTCNECGQDFETLESFLTNYYATPEQSMVERLAGLLADCLDLLKIALREKSGAFPNAVWTGEIPRFEKAIEDFRQAKRVYESQDAAAGSSTKFSAS